MLTIGLFITISFINYKIVGLLRVKLGSVNITSRYMICKYAMLRHGDIMSVITASMMIKLFMSYNFIHITSHHMTSSSTSYVRRFVMSPFQDHHSDQLKKSLE